jgi:hypothetical protein
MITSSGCRFGHIGRHFVFVVIAGQILLIIRRLARSRSHFQGAEIVVQCVIGLDDRQSSMFRAVFVLHILQKGVQVLGSIRSLVFRIDVNALDPLPKRRQLPEEINNMCRTEEQTSCWSDFSIIFRQLWQRTLHSEE